MKDLLSWCSSKGIKVRFVGEKELADFAGMNPEAAKKFGYKDIKKDELLIDVTLPEDVQFKNLIHELVENEMIADGDPYWVAHKKALKAESWIVKKAKQFVLRRKDKAPIKRATISVSRGK